MKSLETAEEAAESLNGYIRRCKETLEKTFKSVACNCEHRQWFKDVNCNDKIYVCTKTPTVPDCCTKSCPYIDRW